MSESKRFKVYKDEIREFESNHIWGVKNDIVCLEPYMILKEADKCCDLLNNQQDEIQQLKEKLQISEGSLALLIDIILLGDVDELVERARECARQFAEQFDKFTKEEIEEMITGGVSNE